MEKRFFSIMIIIFTFICVAIMLYNNSILEKYINNIGKDSNISAAYKEENYNKEIKIKSTEYTLYKMPKSVVIEKEEKEYKNLKTDMQNYYESLNPGKANESYVSANDKEMLINASKKLSKNDYNKVKEYLLLDNKSSIITVIDLLRDRFTDGEFNGIKYIADKYKKWNISIHI